jgi:acyl-CoA reductase-like NAD-dependent aldehyde dehydrogenase
MGGKLFNAGQTCIAPDYALVPDGQRDAFVAAARAAVKTMYPTLEDNGDYTAIVNDRHYARLRGYVEDARAKGAEVVELNPRGAAPEPARRKFVPTLVIDPTDEMTVMQEEIFGPILPVRTYRQLDDALAYVNEHPRPLALYYFGYDAVETERVLNETISGGVAVNDTVLQFAQEDVPFGGVGPSGMGHYHGFEGFEQFSKKKPVFRQSRLNAAGLMSPPYGRVIDTFLRLVLGR